MKQLLNFIGRGSCFNTEELNTSAYFKLDTYGVFTLIDCGFDIFKRVISLGLLDNVKDVNIIITHLHDDHSGSLGALIEYCYFIKDIKPTVYFADMSAMSSFLGSVKILPDMYEIKDHYYDICENEIVFVPVEHGIHKNCYGLAMNLWDGYVYYSGDSSDIDMNYLVEFDGIDKQIRDFDQFYQDLTLESYPDNPHMNIDKFRYRFNTPTVDNVYAIHSDGVKTDLELLKLGFKIPTVIYNRLKSVINVELTEDKSFIRRYISPQKEEE